MGTRSLTKVYDYDGTLIVSIHRQYDGYYSGHGQELADWLASKTLVNGIRGDMDKSTIANGPGCLAAQMISYFKEQHGVGGVYLPHPDPEGRREYTYEVRCVGDYAYGEKSIRLVAQGYYGIAFNGDPADFDGAYLGEVDCEEYDPDIEPARRAALAKLVGVLTDEDYEVLGIAR